MIILSRNNIIIESLTHNTSRSTYSVDSRENLLAQHILRLSEQKCNIIKTIHNHPIPFPGRCGGGSCLGTNTSSSLENESVATNQTTSSFMDSILGVCLYATLIQPDPWSAGIFWCSQVESQIQYASDCQSPWERERERDICKSIKIERYEKLMEGGYSIRMLVVAYLYSLSRVFGKV